MIYFEANDMNRNFQWKYMSPMRRKYMLRLAGRIIVFILCAVMLALNPAEFGILQGWNFFDGLSIFHLLWGIWVLDMFFQILPVGKEIPLGSQKLFKIRFIPVREIINRENIKAHVVATSKAAGRVMILWLGLTAVLGLLRWKNFIDDSMLFMIAVFFYVSDLICVLIWCPFRLIMRNRCCTTCRIFNWDHLMMFTPFVFVKGFYGWSLLALAIGAVILWEICVMLYPERFWDQSNAALQCSQCTDKLCTQYCRKLR